MLKPPSTDTMRTPHGPRVSIWLRRTALLGAVALSLAAAGSPAAARTQGAAGLEGSPWLADIGSHGVALATSVFGAVHRSVGSWSEATTEAVSLLLLGCGLIATSRWLGRERRQRQAVMASAAVTAAEAAALNPQDARIASIARRAVR